MMRVWLCLGLMLIGQNLFAQSADGVLSLFKNLDAEASETLGVKLDQCSEETCAPGAPGCRTKLEQELSQKYAGEIRVTPFGAWTFLTGYASCPAEAAKIKQAATCELQKINKCQPLVVDCVQTETPQVMLHTSLWELNLKRLREAKQEPEMQRLRQQLQEITLLQKDSQETGFVALLTKENAETFSRQLKKLRGKNHSSPSLMVLSEHNATLETANVKLAGTPEAESLLRAVLNVCPTVEPGTTGDIRLDVRVQHELCQEQTPTVKTTAKVNTQVKVKCGQSCVVGWPLSGEQFMIQVITAERVQPAEKPVVAPVQPLYGDLVLHTTPAPAQKTAPVQKPLPSTRVETPRIGIDFDFNTHKTVVSPLPAPVVVYQPLPAPRVVVKPLAAPPAAVPVLPAWSQPQVLYAPSNSSCLCAEGCKCCAQAIVVKPAWAGGGMQIRLTEVHPHRSVLLPQYAPAPWVSVKEPAKTSPEKCCPVQGCPVESCPVEGCPESAKCCPPSVTVYPHPPLSCGAPVYHDPVNVLQQTWFPIGGTPGLIVPPAGRHQHLAEAVKHLRQAGHEKLANDVEAVMKKEQRDHLEARIRQQQQALEQMQKQLQELKQDGHTPPAKPQKKVIFVPNVELEFEIAPQGTEPSAKGGDQSPLGKSVAEYWLDKGREVEQQRRFDEAFRCYRQALLHTPDHPEALHRLGVIYDHQGQFLKAEHCYRQALKHSPKNADILNDLGYSCLQQDRLSESEACLSRAYELAPTHQQVLHNFARLYLRLGHEEKALEMFRHSSCGSDTVARELLKLAQQHQQTEAHWLRPAEPQQETEFFKLPSLESLTPGEQPTSGTPAPEPQETTGTVSDSQVFSFSLGLTR